MQTFKLNSPYGGEPAIFNWKLNAQIPDESNEIFQIINYLSDDYSELKELIDEYTSNQNILENSERLRILCDKFNSWNKQENRTYKIINDESDRPSANLMRYIMQLIYNRAVLDPDKLNQYEPFSPQVYGETSFDLVDQLLSKIKLKESDIFVDLGSGVGNVVLHIAAMAKCKICYGFEKAEWPAHYAKRMENEFRFWMKFFGKTFSNFKLIKGDFLSDEEFVELNTTDPMLDQFKKGTNKATMNDYVKEIINNSNLIFVNNYAFGAEVDHQLKLRFCNMLEGSMIVSSKPFCPLNFRINSRNLNDIGTILNVSEYEPLNGHVSWTDKPINYYFHKIDRTLLEKYFESRKNGKKDDEIYDKHRTCTEKLTSPGSLSHTSSTSSSISINTSLTSPSSPNSSLSSVSPGDDSKKRLKHKQNKRKKPSGNSADNKLKKKIKLNSTKVPSTSSSSLTSIKLLQKRTRSKSLDKDAMCTLERMHKEVANMDNKQTDKNKQQSSFNIKSMTKLTNDNLDNKSLKDCKISNKFHKQHQKLNSSSRSSSVNNLANNKINDSEDILARKELGDDVVNAIDCYLRKLKRQYVKYFMYLKSDDYKEKIKHELQQQSNIKKDLLSRKELIEHQTNSLMKANITLLKLRTAECGLKDLKVPSDLIQYASDILNEHTQLKQKINNLALKTAQLEQQNEQQQSVLTASVISDNNSNGSNEQSSKLNELLNIIESKSDSKIKKASSDNGFKDDIKSVDSNKSIDDSETLTATEKGDDEDDYDMEHMDSDFNSNLINNSKLDLKLSRENSDFNKLQNPCPSNKKLTASNKPQVSNKALIEQLLTKSESLKSFKIPKQNSKNENESALIGNNKNNTPPGSPGIFSSSSSSSSSSLSFNSNNNNPKTSFTNALNSNSPPPPLGIQSITNTSKSNKSYQRPPSDLATNYYDSNDSPPIYSDSGNQNQSNTNLSNDSGQNGNHNKSYSNYYHPKKNQFRQYMMESSTNSSSSSLHPSLNPNNNSATSRRINSHSDTDEYYNSHRTANNYSPNNYSNSSNFKAFASSSWSHSKMYTNTEYPSNPKSSITNNETTSNNFNVKK